MALDNEQHLLFECGFTSHISHIRSRLEHTPPVHDMCPDFDHQAETTENIQADAIPADITQGWLTWGAASNARCHSSAFQTQQYW
jgi:hypothetical protein